MNALNPMPLADVLANAIDPALQLLPGPMHSDAARIMLLAIGLQESKFAWRAQIVPGDPYAKGPARGYWQNERGGIQCVITNVATSDLAAVLCQARGVAFDAGLIHAKLEFDDILAAGFARLFLFADPHPLPVVDASDAQTWDCYVRNWRPGKPRPEDWPDNHAAARAQVLGEAQ